jgi:3'(2'), 5'-bisphosphate nucleotidase
LKPALPTEALLDELKAIARRAGEVVMTVYAGEWNLRDKADSSPVTQADELAEALIASALASLAPDIPLVAEEAFAAGKSPAVGKCFWLVDPLDGTREFIQRNGEFTVNIALIDDGRPVMGVVFAPAIDRLFAGAIGHGAMVEDVQGRRDIRCRTAPNDGITVLASRSHGDETALQEFLRAYKVAETKYSGSSLKLCLLAEGQADLYPRFGRTMEWDTAAGHAVLSAAGGRVTDMNGNDLRYGKPGFENPNFVASGK